MVEIGLQFANIRDWIDNLLCSFSNSGLSTQNFDYTYEYVTFQTYFLSLLVKEKDE